MTYPSADDFGLLYNGIIPQGAPQAQHAGAYTQVHNTSGDNGRNQDPLSVFTSEELTWRPPGEAANNDMTVPGLQPQWIQDAAGAQNGEVRAERGVVTDTGPEPNLPDLLDNEEWLTHYFDRIEDFEWSVSLPFQIEHQLTLLSATTKSNSGKV